MKIALVGGTLVDGRGGAPVPASTVVVDGTRIVGAGADITPDPDATVIDVSGKTVMPGLIDSHVHFAGWAQRLASLPNIRLMYLAARSVYAMRRTLELGVTTARDLGGLEAGFVEAADAGVLTAPRLQTCVSIIHPRNGVLDNIPSHGGLTTRRGLNQMIPGAPVPYCDGPWEARGKVREVLSCGAQVIKIATSSQSVKDEVQWELPTFTEAEVAAIVSESHAAGVKVTSHAIGSQGAMTAVKAGVDGIEHGWGIDDEVLEAMAERGTWLIPTFFIADYHRRFDPTVAEREQADRLLHGALDTVARARAMGIRIAMGSDAGEHAIGGSIEELSWMVEAGMTPTEVITAATSGAAEWLGVADHVGTLEVGKEADLLVVDGDPTADITVMRRPLPLVMKRGEAVYGALAPSLSEWEPIIQRSSYQAAWAGPDA
ncbi:amidohydrolase family protein [Sphaerimonospora mesophila]|uniref:amidohydrolase family protein n=1 Tax=Sphaerimonospora mesophila TaxID=37483 RepID=UPI0006E1697E